MSGGPTTTINSDLILSSSVASLINNNQATQFSTNSNMVSSSTNNNANHDLYTNQVQRQNYFNNGNKNANSSSSNHQHVPLGATSLINTQFHSNGNFPFQNEIKFKKLAFYEFITEVSKPVILQRKLKFKF